MQRHRPRWIGLELTVMALVAACSRDDAMNEGSPDASVDASGAGRDGGALDAGRFTGGTSARSGLGGADAGVSRGGMSASEVTGGTRSGGASAASAGKGGGLGRGGTLSAGGKSQGGLGSQTGGVGGATGQAGAPAQSGAGGDSAEVGGGTSAQAGGSAVQGGTVGTAGSAGLGVGGGAGESGIAGTSPQAGASGTSTAGASGAGGSSGVVCQRAADCPAGNVCGEPRVDGLVYCVPPSTTGGPLGAPCTTGLGTPECYDRICPLGVSSRCSRSCVDDSDCSSVAGYVCSSVGTYRFCLPSCTTSTQCGAGESCALGVNTAGDLWHFVCVTARTNGVAAGTACPTDTTTSMCASGLCLQGTAQGDLCTVPCTTTADCPPGMPNCVNVTLATPVAGAAQQVLACTP